MAEREQTDKELWDAYQQFEQEMVREIPLAAWGGVVLYTVPGAIILAALAWLEVNADYWTPVTLLYVMAAMAHLVGEGTQQVLGMMRLHSPLNYRRVRRLLLQRDGP